MICGRCGARNPAKNKFCQECGTRLDVEHGAQPLPEAEFAATPPPTAPEPEPTAEEQIRQLLNRAFELYEAGQLDEAIATCLEVVKIEPLNASAHSLLGMFYEKKGEVEQAIREYETVLEINPHSSAERASLARLRGEEGDRGRWFSAWRPYGRPALAAGGAFLVVLMVGLWWLWPRGEAFPPEQAEAPSLVSSPAALLATGKRYLANGYYPQAVQVFRRVLELDPQNEEAQRLYRQAQWQARQRTQLAYAAPRTSGPFTSPPAASATPSTSAQARRPRSSSPPPRPAPPRRSAPASEETPTLSLPPLPPVELEPLSPGALTSEESLAVGSERARPRPDWSRLRRTPAPSSGPAEASQGAGTDASSRWRRLGPSDQFTPATPTVPPPEAEPYIHVQVDTGSRTRPSVRREQPLQPTTSPQKPRPQVRDLVAEAQQHERNGHRLLRQGRYQQAIAEYRKALSTAPNYPNAGYVYQQIGFCYGRLQQYEQAIEAWRKAEQYFQRDLEAGRGSPATESALRATREAIAASEAYARRETVGNEG